MDVHDDVLDCVGIVTEWVKETTEGRLWLAAMAAEVGVPLQLSFPFAGPTAEGDSNKTGHPPAVMAGVSKGEEDDGEVAGQSESDHHGG